MEEAEWLECTEPAPMLGFLFETSSNRKLRLFACACCRTVWHLLTEGQSTDSVEIAERFADDQATEQERLAVCVAGHDVAAEKIAPDERRVVFAWNVTPDSPAACAALAAAASASHDDGVYQAARDTLHYARVILSVDGDYSSGNKANTDLLRDIFGNPFRPVSIDPAWRTRDVVALAQAAYEERILPAGHLDPDRLAILSDALEDAGCTEAEVLGHLRGPGPHVRGCFAIDAVLGKA